MSNTTKSVRPTKIGRVKAAELISETNGKLFTATFVKADGTERTMTCRLGVKKGVKATPKRKAPDTSKLGMVNVFDMRENAYKKINLQTVKALKTKGVQYKVS